MRLVPVLTVVMLATSAAASPGVRVYQNQTNSRITEGETVVPGDPAVIYGVVEDYARWVEVFPDVAKVVITWKKGTDARVTLVKPDGNQDNLKFHQTPQARMVYFEDTGNEHADVWGEIVCAPGDQPGTTRIHTRLYVDVHGLATLVVADGDVRKMREQRIQRDLEHVRGYFTRTSSR
jgi:hypothetical protein